MTLKSALAALCGGFLALAAAAYGQAPPPAAQA